MRITVVGAGAMGGSYGGLLARAGHEVSLIDAWQAHVDAINRDGLRLDGAHGEHRIRLAAATGASGSRPRSRSSSSTPTTPPPPPQTVAKVLAPDGCAISFQNGIGNVEKLQAVLGARAACSAARACAAPRPAGPATSA